MSDNGSGTVTRRDVIRATGGGLAAGLGATGAASAHCTPCDECTPCGDSSPCTTLCGDSGSCIQADDDNLNHNRFCGTECVVTYEETEVYDKCPFDALSHVSTIGPDRGGFIADICEDGCEEGLKVDFDCTDTWWVEADDVCVGDDSNCLC